MNESKYVISHLCDAFSPVLRPADAQILDATRARVPEHLEMVEGAVSMSFIDQTGLVGTIIQGLIDNPSMVDTCAFVEEFSSVAKHKNIRYTCYRQAATQLGYSGKGLRLPLPWPTEIMVKGLFPGDGPLSWVLFKAEKTRLIVDSLNRIQQAGKPVEKKRKRADDA